MASKPSPSADRLTRVLRPLAERREGARLGTAGRAAEALRTGLHVGLRQRLGELQTVEGPWGLWRTAGDESTPQQLPNRALARYAESLRRKRGPGRPVPVRGLPLVIRRRGATALAPRSGPGGLARALVPVDRPERPDVAAILRDGRRPAAVPAPLPRPRTDPRRGR